MMDDLIRRSDALIECEGLTPIECRAMKERIKSIPAVEPKHGEWIINNNGWAYCSECESLGLESYNFCTYCGAKMKGADDEDSNMGHSDM